jgi:uncharacterized membrane protein (DUF106 family)
MHQIDPHHHHHLHHAKNKMRRGKKRSDKRERERNKERKKKIRGKRNKILEDGQGYSSTQNLSLVKKQNAKRMHKIKK